jgi:hypothetical protein
MIALAHESAIFVPTTPIDWRWIVIAIGVMAIAGIILYLLLRRYS